MSKRAKRAKRADYRRPAGQQPPPAPRQPLPVPVVRSPRRAADWWPLAAAAGLTLLLVLIIVVVNVDSPPQLTRP